MPGGMGMGGMPGGMAGGLMGMPPMPAQSMPGMMPGAQMGALGAAAATEGEQKKGFGKGKGRKGGGGKGKGKSDIYYAGIVKATTAETPKGQVILDCPRVNELFGADAWFPVGEWPEGLLKGGVVVFTVRENGEVGTAPRAMHVARLQVSPVLVRKELAEEAAAVAAAAAAEEAREARAALPVRKTIAKR
mmetsp:Transcript_15395/g.42425  ORF Transcript_15395/g.42425 Transcript_15395/m.42425 type:complete len:190 (-) Transcript_15395:34-603(-)